MIRSMTGFGKAVCNDEGDPISVELSSVNHRYLDCSVRLPPAWAALEPIIKETVKRRLSRGKLQANVSRSNGSTGKMPIVCDIERARQYIEASRELAALLNEGKGLSVDVLAAMDGVFTEKEPDADMDRVQERLVKALEEALDQLNRMRKSEGEALAADVRDRVALIRESLAAIEARLPQLNENYEQRLRTRIQELASDISITEERIAIEVAMLAEKGDVTEETVRLKTHLDHIIEMLDSAEPVGRRLDFLTQEVQREANTLGVKTRDTEVTKDVLRIKSEVEKIREQVQNIE